MANSKYTIVESQDIKTGYQKGEVLLLTWQPAFHQFLVKYPSASLWISKEWVEDPKKFKIITEEEFKEFVHNGGKYFGQK